MFHLIMGLGDPFSVCCARVACSARQLSGSTATILRVGTLEQLAAEALRVDVADYICLLETADNALLSAAAACSSGLLLAIGSPMAALASRIDRQAAPVFHDFAHVLAACTTLDATARLSGGLVLSARMCAAEPEAAIGAIAMHVRASLDADALAILAASEGDALRDAATLSLHEIGLAPLAEAAGSPARAMAMATALDAYVDGRFQPEHGAQILDGTLFVDGTPQHNPLDAGIDVTGPARFLVVGPGLRLPVGDWDARFVLDISDAATEGRYKIDVAMWSQGQLSILAEAVFTAAAPGLCSFSLSFRHSSPEGALQYRLLSERAMFDGMVFFHRVELSPRDRGRDRTIEGKRP